jgi:tripartite-type tricarboxylate transporter receptor subunit TctC
MFHRRSLGGVFAALAGARAASAQDGAVLMVVPYTPGTGHDILARLMQPWMTRRLGQPMVVENRAGASGNIGTAPVARAAPDGRTLVLRGNAVVMNPHLFRSVPFDVQRDLTPIAMLTRADMVLAVRPEVRAQNAAEFAALARAEPGRIDYASPGVGTPHHMAMALFAVATRTQLTHVPYRGTAPAIQDLLGGRIPAMMLPVHIAMPMAREGRIRVLAVGGTRRSALAPDVPTFAEQGLPEVEVDVWYAVLGPAGMAPDLVRRLNALFNEWLAQPDVQDALRAQGMVPDAGTPEQLAAVIARDLRKWGEVVRAAGITAE